MKGTCLQFLRLTVTIGLVLSAAACRVKSPTIPEQQALMNRGSFPAGTPPWLYAGAGTGVPQAQSGVVAPTVSAPAPIANQAESSDMQNKQLLATSAKPAEPAKKAPAVGSPFDRITTLCPNAESAVRQTLTETDREKRISQYEALTKSCPSSTDLWSWLGSDYKKAGRYDEAKSAFEQALALDNNNEDARAALKELSSAAAPVSPGK